MADLLRIILIIFGIMLIYLIFKFIKNIFKLIRKRVPRKVFLSRSIRAKADRKYYKLYGQFKRKYHREPNKNEKFRIIINASHITIRRRGKSGHWGRQKVRKYLLEKNKIVHKFVMR